MDEKEINTILKYKRPCDSWLCPECDTENNMSFGKCMVCGCRKSATDTILKQWTEESETPRTPPKKTQASQSDEPIFKDVDKEEYVPEEEDNKIIVIWFIIIAIVIGLIIAASQGHIYAATLDEDGEIIDSDYEIVTTMYDELQQEPVDIAYIIDEQDS